MRQVGLLTGKTPTSTPKPETTSKPEKGLAGIWDRLKTWVDQIFTPENKTPTSTPETLLIQTEVPIKTPKMTQPPSPTPTPTPTPVPTPGKREQIANAVVSFATENLDKPYTQTGNTGRQGYDCSGLVRAACKEMGSGLKFKQGYISHSCEDGMAQDFIDNPDYGKAIYKYQDGGAIQDLQAGDLVFSADSGNLSVDKHVTIATGEGLQVIEASYVAHKVTNDFNAYASVSSDGLYVRESGQIITYVIRPNYDWEENP